MSFSKTIKDEIIKRNIYKKEPMSLIQGIFMCAGSLVISGGSLSFVVSSENENVINFLNSLLKQVYNDVQTDIAKIVKSFKTKERFEISVFDPDKLILKDLKIVSENKDGEMTISELCDLSFMKSKDSMLAFLTGAFLGSGSLSVPDENKNKKSYGYHFEISTSSKELADTLAEILSNFDIFPKMVERNQMFVIYLKNCDIICDTLSLFGANKVVLDMLNLRVSRDMNNLTNRQINCISANIDKTVNAALKQIEAIEIIQNIIGIENLPETLNEAALLRLSNPEGSLKDLLVAQGNKISKGALAQRFDKIIKLAEELGEKDDK